MDLIVVDAANVIGSRPDGWWRDRAGAALRLHFQLLDAHLGVDVILVVEGEAKAGLPEAVTHHIRTVHAATSGDDAVVDTVHDVLGSVPDDGRAEGAEVIVVTADRELRRRVEQAGARVVGPGWLLERL